VFLAKFTESDPLKIYFSNQQIIAHPRQNQAGMTLIEILIAVAITALTVIGIVRGYEFCLASSVKDSFYMAAIARAQERIEQTHSARWITTSPQINELQPSNFPPETVVLDLFAQSTNSLTAILKTTISDITTSPPVKLIHVDCIWRFEGNQWVTNSIETCRAPDQ